MKLVLTSTCLCPFPTPFLQPLFKSKSTEFANWIWRSTSVLHIQRWCHHIKSERAGDKFSSGVSEEFLTTTMFKVHLFGPLTSVGPFSFMGLFTCIGPFHFRVAVLHLYRAFHYHVGPIHPHEAPSRAVRGGLHQLWFL